MNESQYNKHGNLIFEIASPSTSGCIINKKIVCSDLILSEFKEYGDILRGFKIIDMHIRSKQLDNPPSNFVSFFAKVVQINIRHEFLVFETELFLITVDFYENNRVLIRIGDPNFVFEESKSQSRKNSKVLKVNDLVQWRKVFNKSYITVGFVIDYIIEAAKRDYKKLGYNGSDFSKQIFGFLTEYSKNN